MNMANKMPCKYVELTMKTVLTWLKMHPGVNVFAFEKNPDKSFGFGEFEEVCGFCLASHYFEKQPPEICPFCRAPLWETHAISDLTEITERIYDFSGLFGVYGQPERKLPFIVRTESGRKP